MKNSETFFEDLEKYRTPSEMKSYFELKKDQIIKDKEYNDLARLKTGRFKVFLEEFYPLFCFSQSNYVPKNSELKVVIGNQGYDGLIKIITDEVRRVEITEYIDGKEEFEDAKKINERGYSRMIVTDTSDLATKAENYLEKVINNASKKANKNYKGVTLIIVINTFIHINIWELDNKAFINNAICRIKLLPFNADEVFLLVKNGDQLDKIDNNIYKIK